MNVWCKGTHLQSVEFPHLFFTEKSSYYKNLTSNSCSISSSDNIQKK
ncbi:hypothetical protein LEP1GSC081_2647 [Leptospira kirschneri str. H1]|uniref:Uncharacterized protein n=1 Tax=Leptospira kirschneri str. H1 TaxID=1049966 RepID=A0A0E2B647_9LEPT|nr:hypothetical protein LEP1GSC081_2647 [Leptospira kirschneri str. H1]